MWIAVAYFCFSVATNQDVDMACTAHAMPQRTFPSEKVCMLEKLTMRAIAAFIVRDQVDGALLDFSYRCLMVPEKV